MLEAHQDDPVVEELTSFINSLSEDEQVDLVALAWPGRDNAAGDWPAMREEAARVRDERTAAYLLSMPQVSDFLEESLSRLGHSCQDYKIARP